ncbi:hypothetical protein SO802_004398 [Lithocarpus litseifolius]|uniref:Uncharacterized protein n=1 Tax=Lithocarpus litseifolius TaxID=425828 RepID=A0AAW2E4K7_9ROSI
MCASCQSKLRLQNKAVCGCVQLCATNINLDIIQATNCQHLKLSVNETCRGDIDGRVPVGGYVVGYKGVTFATVRGAGHEVPSYQPERALTMISSFLTGKLPPIE